VLQPSPATVLLIVVVGESLTAHSRNTVIFSGMHGATVACVHARRGL
jgi:hypothetical protein